MNTIPLEPPTGEFSANDPHSLNNSPCFLCCLCLSGPGHDELVFPEVRPSVMLVLRNALGNVPGQTHVESATAPVPVWGSRRSREILQGALLLPPV